jgi:thymidylate synthase (FAD)
MEYPKQKVLDFGYVKLIETWGKGEADVPEAGIIEAARQSTQGSFRGWEQDEKLLKHLYNNKHSTPFEFAGMVVEVQAPIFVFREWHRHRTQGYNEASARYLPLPDLNYLPTYNRLLTVQTANKQAQGTGHVLETLEAQVWLKELEGLYEHAQKVYARGLEAGVPKELARLAVPVARYSRMRATTCLRNWLGFMTLRCDPNAQWEIRMYADEVSTLISQHFPKTWELWRKEFDKE